MQQRTRHRYKVNCSRVIRNDGAVKVLIFHRLFPNQVIEISITDVYKLVARIIVLRFSCTSRFVDYLNSKVKFIRERSLTFGLIVRFKLSVNLDILFSIYFASQC